MRPAQIPKDDNPSGDTCKWCKSAELEPMICGPGSPHHAKLVCLDCGRMQRWIAKPIVKTDGPPAELMALIVPREHPCILQGSENQCFRARQYRANAIFKFGRKGRDDLVNLSKSITSASWWMANHGKSFEEIRWPSANQVLQTGLASEGCPICGIPTYGAEFCSYEHADQSRKDDLAS